MKVSTTVLPMKGMRKIFITVLAAGAANLPASALGDGTRELPVPQTASREMQTVITAGPLPYWNTHPGTVQEWKSWVDQLAQESVQTLPALQKVLDVSVEPSQMAGVPVFIVTPRLVAPQNRHRLLIHFHGGGYVLNPGKAGTAEAVMMAGYGNIRVVSVDYRMPPDFPYPAAIDDALAVYREIIQNRSPDTIGVFGTSTGGAMTLALSLRAKDEKLPLPGAIAVGTPWTDLTKTGDSYFTNDGVDNVLVRYEGWLGAAAKLYAGTHDPKHPYLSPVYGDVRGLPPALLVSGTRDLFLSNTVRMHWRLRDADVPADLLVFEGLSHAQYLMSVDAPETRQYFDALSRFFDIRLTDPDASGGRVGMEDGNGALEKRINRNRSKARGESIQGEMR